MWYSCRVYFPGPSGSHCPLHIYCTLREIYSGHYKTDFLPLCLLLPQYNFFLFSFLSGDICMYVYVICIEPKNYYYYPLEFECQFLLPPSFYYRQLSASDSLFPFPPKNLLSFSSYSLNFFFA